MKLKHPHRLSPLGFLQRSYRKCMQRTWLTWKQTVRLVSGWVELYFKRSPQISFLYFIFNIYICSAEGIGSIQLLCRPHQQWGSVVQHRTNPESFMASVPRNSSVTITTELSLEDSPSRSTCPLGYFACGWTHLIISGYSLHMQKKCSASEHMQHQMQHKSTARYENDRNVPANMSSETSGLTCRHVKRGSGHWAWLIFPWMSLSLMSILWWWREQSLKSFTHFYFLRTKMLMLCGEETKEEKRRYERGTGGVGGGWECCCSGEQ